MGKNLLVSNVLPRAALMLIPSEVSVDYNDSLAVLSKPELIARLRGKDGLICHIVSTIDDEVLAAAPTVKIVANVAVGYNNIDVDADVVVADRHVGDDLHGGRRGQDLVVDRADDVADEAVLAPEA